MGVAHLESLEQRRAGVADAHLVRVGVGVRVRVRVGVRVRGRVRVGVKVRLKSLMPTSAARVTDGREVDPLLRRVPDSVALDVWCAPQPSWLHSSRSPPTVSSAWMRNSLSVCHSPE